MADISKNIWFVDAPGTPAKPPEWMSFSTLVAMESCPRQWSLSRSSYSTIWNGVGYPPNPSIPALSGQIVHRSIEIIVKLVVSSRIPSIDDPVFVQRMRELGGYPSIVMDEIERIDGEIAGNPRLVWRRSDLKNGLMLQIETIREAIQLLLSDLEISQGFGVHLAQAPSSTHRKPLTIGQYAEIDLRSPKIKWYGKVDYLKVQEGSCEIVDFKTGQEKPEHEFQMNIYDLLWAEDRERNIDSLPLKVKALLYPSRKVDVAPLSEVELEGFKEGLLTRSKAVAAAVLDQEPVAQVAVENCCFCSVRHMCSNYWEQTAQTTLLSQQGTAGISFSPTRADLEVRLISSTNARIWKANVLVGMFFQTGVEILIHFGDYATRWSACLKPGARVRLLNSVKLSSSSDGVELAMDAVGIKSNTELFVISDANI